MRLCRHIEYFGNLITMHTPFSVINLFSTHMYIHSLSFTYTHSHSLSLEYPHTQAVGSVSMAYQCFKLSLTANNSHSEAYNNLGVIEWRRGRGEQVSVCVGGWVDGCMCACQCVPEIISVCVSVSVSVCVCVCVCQCEKECSVLKLSITVCDNTYVRSRITHLLTHSHAHTHYIHT